MSLDPEMQALLSALAEGQLKLSEGQLKLSNHVDSLAKETRETKIVLAHFATATEAAIERLVERVDDFGRRVVVGSTNAAAVDRKLEDVVGALDARVKALERKNAAKVSSKKRRR